MSKLCKDCLYYAAHKAFFEKLSGKNTFDKFFAHAAAHCEFFTARSEWMHLPFKVGDTVWYITGIHNTLIKSAKIEELHIDETGISYIGVRTDNNIYFETNTNEFYSTREKAEKALEDINNG